MKLNRVTLTGADDSVDPEQLLLISEKFPFVEWGILISKNHFGSPRFPSLDWIRRLMNAAERSDAQFSAHLCGEWVRDIANQGDFTAPRELAREGRNLNFFRRIQLNFHGEPHGPDKDGRHLYLDVISNLNQSENPQQFIFQQDGVNDRLFYRTQASGLNTVPLFDTSHGAGILPGSWPSPIAQYQGYAGGLGPANVLTELAKIRQVCENWFWIDMETKLRFGGGFALDLCTKVLEQTAPFIGENGL